MILNKLTLHNFGPYRSHQEYDLAPKTRYGTLRPIILFGGKNGAGKTTIFEAINLCLYGPSSTGRAITKKEYEEYLDQKIHRNSKSNHSFKNAGVALEFFHAHGGAQDMYSVSRSWRKNGKKIKEHLDVKRNGEYLKDLDPAQWNTFVKELIPPGIAQLFFFDGEKIRKLSGDRPTDRIYFVDSIKSLLGIDLIDRLRKDLSIYAKRSAKKDPNEALAEDLADLQERHDELENHLIELKQDRAQVENEIQRKKNEIFSVEQEIASMGGEFFTKYDSLRSKRAQLGLEITHVEDRVREMCHGLFPFALCADLCKKLKERLHLERDSMKWQNFKVMLQGHIDRLADEVESEVYEQNQHEVSTETDLTISQKIKTISDKILKELAPTISEDVVVHDLSSGETETITSWMERSLTASATQTLRYCRRLEALNEKLANIEMDIARAPSEELLKPLINRLNNSNQGLGASELKAARLEDEIRGAAFQLRLLESKLEKINSTILDSDRLNERLKLVAQTQTVLQNFSDDVKFSKVQQIQETITELFQRLSRKQDLIDRLTVDPEDFSIKLFDKTGLEIPKKNLSSGEKQVFAIAMLWSLRKVSGRPIPVIIDTPLSRLDSDHRTKLVNNYFPYASHQTIILSTDTEIDKDYFEGLKSSISHVYHLNFYEDQGMTLGEEGYFWKKREAA